MAWYQSPSILHPMAGANPVTFLRNSLAYGPYAWRSLLPRVLAATGVAVRLPFYFKEKWLHDRAIRDHQLSVPPIFIVGHWRSGTTHLHNILSQDAQFATISFMQTSLPWDCLGKFKPARPLIRAILPKTRGMDAVEVGIDTPQEEEMALGSMNDLSFYKCFYFPQQLMQHFRQSVMLEGITPEQLAGFEDAYEYIVRKMSYAEQGKKRILFKNPASTARIPMLKKIFPEAKFVHIVRDPYAVYGSMGKLWDRLTDAFSWQDRKGVDYEKATREIYAATNQRYLRDRELLSAGDLCEVRFEDLAKNPKAVVEKIYRELNIGGLDVARGSIDSYLAAQTDYESGQYRWDDDIRERLGREWGFAFDTWRYER
jgi:hypothetical protein